VSLRSVPQNPLVDQLQLTASGGPQPTPRTLQVLRVYNLEKDVKDDPRELLQKLQLLIEQEPTAEKVYCFAELAYLGAKRAESHSKEIALDLYGASVMYSYHYLFDPHFAEWRNPYDPQFRMACDLYNSALEDALRLVCASGKLVPGEALTMHTTAGDWEVTCVLRGSRWRPEDFDHFKFVSDYEMKGLKNHYRTHGLGVPLIAVRRGYEGEPAAARYYPDELSFPVTAFLRPVATGPSPVKGVATARHQALLELYDPLTTVDTELAGRHVPLESDLTVPLAYFLSKPEMEALSTVGLLRPEELLKVRPDRPEPIMGLYLCQPYEPGKIPVLMVHGLWSSPMTWMEMFNDLRSCPEIRDRYQFWFYLYPTGQPFWISAAQMRRDLEESRKVLDPYREEPALDQMVLVGHSMGGLVSRLQTLNSKEDFWHLVSEHPIDEIRADPEVRRKLEETFFFRPNPSVRRVVTLGTPHRGSRLSNQTTQWMLAKLIRMPQTLLNSQQKLFLDNKDLLRDGNLLRIETSVDSLSPDSPFFPVMLASQRPPWVKYHNVVGVLPKGEWLGRLMGAGDGVVPESSARVDDVVSEIAVPANHSMVHAHPAAVLEVRRILLEHLDELRNGPSVSRTAARSVAPVVR
jgi:hypothetical protein